MYLGIDPGSSRIMQSLPLDDRSFFSTENVAVALPMSSAAPPTLTSPRSNKNSKTTIGCATCPVTCRLLVIKNPSESFLNTVEPREFAEIFFHPGD